MMERKPNIRTAGLLLFFLLFTSALAVGTSFHVRDLNSGQWLLVHWDERCIPVPWDYTIGGTVDVTDPLDKNEISASFQTWQDVPVSTIAFFNRSDTAFSDAGVMDGINIITWKDNYNFPPGVLGNTPVFYYEVSQTFPAPPDLNGDGTPDCSQAGTYPAGSIFDADIRFNDTDWTWTTNPSGPGVYIKAVAIHEMGHFIGIAHTLSVRPGQNPLPIENGPGTIMWPFLGSDNVAAATMQPEEENAAATNNPDAAEIDSNWVSFSGTLRRPSGVPVFGGWVYAVKVVGAVNDVETGVFTRPDGSWNIAAVRPGDYKICIAHGCWNDNDPPRGVPFSRIDPDYFAGANTSFASECYDANEPLSGTGGDNPSDADILTVAAGEKRTGIDIITNEGIPPVETVYEDYYGAVQETYCDPDYLSPTPDKLIGDNDYIAVRFPRGFHTPYRVRGVRLEAACFDEQGIQDPIPANVRFDRLILSTALPDGNPDLANPLLVVNNPSVPNPSVRPFPGEINFATPVDIIDPSADLFVVLKFLPGTFMFQNSISLDSLEDFNPGIVLESGYFPVSYWSDDGVNFVPLEYLPSGYFSSIPQLSHFTLDLKCDLPNSPPTTNIPPKPTTGSPPAGKRPTSVDITSCTGNGDQYDVALSFADPTERENDSLLLPGELASIGIDSLDVENGDHFPLGTAAPGTGTATVTVDKDRRFELFTKSKNADTEPAEGTIGPVSFLDTRTPVITQVEPFSLPQGHNQPGWDLYIYGANFSRDCTVEFHYAGSDNIDPAFVLNTDGTDREIIWVDDGLLLVNVNVAAGAARGFRDVWVVNAGGCTHGVAKELFSVDAPNICYLTYLSAVYSDADLPGDNNGEISPGEVFSIDRFWLKNVGGASCVGITSTAVPAMPRITVLNGTSTYPPAVAGGSAANNTPFRFKLEDNFPCPEPAVIDFDVTAGATQKTFRLSVPTGVSIVPPEHLVSPNVPVTIQNAADSGSWDVPATTTDTVTATGTEAITSLSVNVQYYNSAVARTYAVLESPQGTEIMLKPMGWGSTSPQDINGSTDAFNGEIPQGDWTLKVTDVDYDAAGTPTDGRISAFELTIYSGGKSCAVAVPPMCLIEKQSTILDDSAGDGDGFLIPDEEFSVYLTLRDIGNVDCTNISVTAVPDDPSMVHVLDATASYPDIAAGGTATNLTPFRFQLDRDIPCPGTFTINYEIYADSVLNNTIAVLYRVGIDNRPRESLQSTAVPVPIHDATPDPVDPGQSDPAETLDVLQSVTSDPLTDLGIVVELHSFDLSAIEVVLVSPMGTEYPLIRHGWVSGSDFSFSEVTSQFNGEIPAGDWTLRVTDFTDNVAGGFDGQVTRFELEIVTGDYFCPTPPLYPPYGVGNTLRAVRSGGDVRLLWQEPAFDATHEPASSYDVYRSELAGSGFVLHDNSPAVSFDDSGAVDPVPSIQYFYKIVARNDGGTSGDEP